MCAFAVALWEGGSGRLGGSGFALTSRNRWSAPCGCLSFAMLAKSEDLTFPSLPNVIFLILSMCFLILSAKEKMCCNVLAQRSQIACVGFWFALAKLTRLKIQAHKSPYVCWFLPSPRTAVFSTQKVIVTRIKHRICESSGTSGAGKVSNFTAQ